MTLTTLHLDPALDAAIRIGLRDRSAEIDVCVAGTGPLAPAAFLDVTEEQWAVQMTVLRDVCLAAGSVARQARQHGRAARIVFLAHPPTIRAMPGASVAAVAGAFLTTFAQVAGIELGSDDITCNVIIAGWTDATRFSDVVPAIPTGRLAQVEDIVGAVAYLASPVASYVTATTLVVDGGLTVSKVGGGSPLLS